ncbi:haloacid dehalogenase [Leifsonia sp. Root4]|uniref:HAD hydrolase-like protein n=1 Tax=Leifsonia sp. Root4 TaxID=1736525 RepID=UPI0006F36C63|nr:HAD hydrolase-like protein [Leifsonia sp. Root4]KQW04977.1 haloacid dehalogenase [Leifsonia sp. Root4]
MSTPTLTTATALWSAILFDLDGTITDSAPGITASLARTFETLGRPVPDAAELLAYVGPPLLDSFRERAGMSEEQAWEAINAYRADYNGSAIDTAVYPGVAGLLERIHAAGVPLALATSKPESVAVRILENFGLDRYFTVICGATDDESRSAKADVVAEAIRRLSAQGVDVSRTVMIGDRSYDAVGAAANGIPTILVEWGYGSPAEAVDAIGTVYSTDQLAKKLLG